MISWHFTLSELIFITAGVFMIVSIPLFQTFEFSLWIAVKAVYMLALITLLIEKLKS